MRLALAVIAVASWSTACSVDTELAVAGEIRSAAITVTGADATAVVGATVEALFRVGDHAPAAREFTPQRIELYDGETALVQVASLSATGAFDRTLGPGEETTVTLVGQTDPGTFTDGIAGLCAGRPITVLLRWEHRDPTMPMTLPDFDLSEADTTDVTCP